MQSCSGTMCDGLYGDKRYACVYTSQCLRRILALSINICINRDGNVVDLSNEIALKVLDYSSKKLTDQLVDCNQLEVRVRIIKIN